MSNRAIAVFASLVALGASGAVSAQDQCKDVLKDGPYAYDQYRDDSYFNQIIWSRFMKSTYTSAKTDRSGGFGVPVGEIVLGANFTEGQYKAKKEQIKNEYFQQINSSREVDIALMSGDEEVLDAWSSCMQRRGGGLSVRFEAPSARDVTLHIEYFNQGTRNADKLARDIHIESYAEVVSGRECLAKGREYVNGKECIAHLRLPTALSTLQVIVETENSTAKAWLPARIQLSRESRPYVFNKSDKLYDWAHKRTTEHRRDIALTEEEMKAGWSFEPASARTGLRRISVNNSRNRCGPEWSDVTPTTFSYGYRIYAGNRRRHDGHIECDMSPYILMKREVWVGLMDPPGDGIQGVVELQQGLLSPAKANKAKLNLAVDVSAADEAAPSRPSVFDSK